MTIPQTANNRHWNHLLALDSDAAKVSRYIEFTPDNYGTYSIELARLLMAAASETDIAAKFACQVVEPKTRPERITEYRDILAKTYPALATYPVHIERYGLRLTPWDSWTSGNTPDWWTAYNKVKHERHNHFAMASLKNTLNALAGLFVMLIYAFPEESKGGRLVPPTLMSIPEDAIDGWSNMGTYTTVHFKL